jgi:hypothetical protein
LHHLSVCYHLLLFIHCASHHPFINHSRLIGSSLTRLCHLREILLTVHYCLLLFTMSICYSGSLVEVVCVTCTLFITGARDYCCDSLHSIEACSVAQLVSCGCLFGFFLSDLPSSQFVDTLCCGYQTTPFTISSQQPSVSDGYIPFQSLSIMTDMDVNPITNATPVKPSASQVNVPPASSANFRKYNNLLR